MIPLVTSRRLYSLEFECDMMRIGHRFGSSSSPQTAIPVLVNKLRPDPAITQIRTGKRNGSIQVHSCPESFSQGIRAVVSLLGWHDSISTRIVPHLRLVR